MTFFRAFLELYQETALSLSPLNPHIAEMINCQDDHKIDEFNRWGYLKQDERSESGFFF